MEKLLLVVNPNAGVKNARRLLPEIISRLTGGGFLCTVYVTEKRGDATEFVRKFGGTADRVVACGGDGTLNEVITGLISGGHKTPLGYLPCGSTNDFAAGLGISTDLLEACSGIVGGEPVPLDIGCFGGTRYFSYTASFGAFTSASYSTPQPVKNVLGHAAYILQGIRSLADIRPIHLSVSSDALSVEDDFIFGAVCNSTSLGGVLKLESSEVHMNDGLFEALLIPYPADLVALNQILAALIQQNHSDPSLLFLRAPYFRFEGGRNVKWTLDGEEAPGGSSITVRNLHAAVTLVMEKARA